MKLKLFDDAGDVLFECSVTQDVIDRVFPEQAKDVLPEALRRHQMLEEDQRVFQLLDESAGGLLESLDDDGEIMGVPLQLNELAGYDFDRHMDAIVGEQAQADKDLEPFRHPNENAVETDRRTKERPLNRIRFKGR